MSDWTNFNRSNTSDFIFQIPKLSYVIPVGIILGLFTVLTVGGNLLVLIAVATDRHLRSQRHTLLIVNLAIFDITLGAIVFPFSASLEVLNDQWLFGRIFCNVWAAIDVLCCTGSIWSLVSIALDRLVGVTKPLAYAGIMTRRKMMMLIGIIWTLSLIISVVPFMGWSTPEEKNPFKCNVQTDVSYVLFSVSVSYYIPLIIILIFYFRIYRAATQHVRSLQLGEKRSSLQNQDGSVMTLRIHKGRFGTEHHNGDVSAASGKLGITRTFARQRKATVTLTIIIFGFICMWQGFFLILPISVLCPVSCAVPTALWKILFWLGYCNSLMNPIIYAFASHDFRRAFKKILCCELFSNKANRRNFDYAMSSSIRRNNNIPAQPRNIPSFLRCFHPCADCLMSAPNDHHATTGYHPDRDTNDSSDTLNSTPNHSHSRNIFKRLSKKSSERSLDLMEEFPLASLTLARLKNPTGTSDLLYGSLQALAQKVAKEELENSSNSCAKSTSLELNIEERLRKPILKSCGTQTPPLSSLALSPETRPSFQHDGRDPPAPDDAVL